MSASAPSRCTRGYNNTDTLVKVEPPRTVRGRLSGVGDGRPVGASAVGDVQKPLSLRFSDAIWIQRSHWRPRLGRFKIAAGGTARIYEQKI
jgi:hypothetical protein